MSHANQRTRAMPTRAMPTRAMPTRDPDRTDPSWNQQRDFVPNKVQTQLWSIHLVNTSGQHIWSIHGEAFVQWQHAFFVHAGLNRRIFSTSKGKETVSIPGVEFANWDIFAGDIQEDVIKVPVVESDADWTQVALALFAEDTRRGRLFHLTTTHNTERVEIRVAVVCLWFC